MTLLAFSCVALVILGVVAYAIEGSLGAPAVVYTVVWLIALSMVWSQGDFFFPISTQTLGIYVFGAICFAVGTFFHLKPMPPVEPPSEFRMKRARLLVVWSLVALVVLFPLFAMEMLRMAGSAAGANGWISLRNAEMELAATPGGGSFSLARNLPEIAIGVAFVSVRLRARRGCSAFLEGAVICVALIYQLLTAARYGAFVLMLGIIVLRATAPGASVRRVFQIAAAFVAAFAIYFFINEVTLGKGVDKTYNTLADNIGLVQREAVVHAVGGLVGFGQIVDNPEIITPNHDPAVFFIHTLNKLGGHFEEFSRNSSPLLVAAPIYYTNVYTIYFCFWPHYGIAGTMLLMCFLGWFSKWCYLRCRAGNDVAAILWALTVNALLMSVLADEFFLTLNGWLKLALAGLLAFGWTRAPKAQAAPVGATPAAA